MTGPVVEVEDAGYAAGGRHLLKEVAFTLEAGTLTAFVGPNGAGKSTMLGLLAGDLEPGEGAVRIGGRAPTAWPARALARERSVMLQRYGASFGFSVAEVVAMGRLPHDADDPLDRGIVAEAMAESDLTALRRRDVTTLSGGEHARVAFAKTAAQTTPVILLDEPTASLDLRHQEDLLRSARSRRDDGATVVAVLHDLNLASRYADRVLVFSNGRLVADGASAEVLTPERVEAVYGQRVHSLPHPETGAPVLVPVHSGGRR